MKVFKLQAPGSSRRLSILLAGLPTLMLRIGAVEPGKYAASLKGGPPLLSMHSAQFAPDREPTLKAAIAAERIARRTLMPKAR